MKKNWPIDDNREQRIIILINHDATFDILHVILGARQEYYMHLVLASRLHNIHLHVVTAIFSSEWGGPIISRAQDINFVSGSRSYRLERYGPSMVGL